METKLDRFGRIVIPKPMRDDLGLKPVRGRPHIVIKKGVREFSGAATEDIAGSVLTVRGERFGEVSPSLRR